MNKKLIIIGSVAILGIGAFFYFKTKAKPKTDTKGAGNAGAETAGAGTSGTDTVGTGTTSVPPTGTTLTTPEQVAETAKKIADAKDLATKISDLRIKRSKYLSLSLSSYATEAGHQFWANHDDMLSSMRNSDIISFDKQIKDLNEQIGKLGYMETNGSIVKIV
jgi:hypothetical protein